MRRRIISVVAVAATVGALVVPLVAAQSASAATANVYVAPWASGGGDYSCGTAAYDNIQDAIESAPIGATVVVCSGWYYGPVTVDRQVNLAGRPGASIDANNGPYAVGVAVSHVKVSGLYVTGASTAGGAPGDGIVTVGFYGLGLLAADYVTISNNVAAYNEGNGIDLNSTSHSSAINNQSTHNGVGINVSDDLDSPAAFNRIISNVASDNYGGCGIVLAEHTGAGIHDNLVSENQADNNGLGTPSAPGASSGSGIILAGGGGGGVWNNTVANNSFTGNGHGGVALHAHAPGMNFSGNKIINNSIGTNNVRKDENDPKTTGIYLGDASPLTITVTGNYISTDYYGVFTSGPVTVNSVLSNTYSAVSVRLGHAATF